MRSIFHWRETFPLLVLVLSFALLPACRQESVPSVTDEDDSVLVRTMVVPRRSDTKIRSFPIFAKPSQTAKLSFRIPGTLVEFDPILGSRVHQGDVVAKLDPRDYQLAVERLERSLDEANAMLKAMKTGARAEDVAALKAQIAAAETTALNARRQFDRMRNLRADGTASEVQYDLAKTNNDMAQAQLETLKTQLEKATSGSRQEEIEAMEAKIAGLNIDLQLAQNKLNDTELRAPFDAVIAEKYGDNHEVLVPGVPVLELVNTDLIEATVNIPSDLVQHQGDIQTISCSFSDLDENRVFPAQIKEIGKIVQRGNLAYPMTLRIDMSESTHSEQILAGMVGTANFTIAGTVESVMIPSTALVQNPRNEEGYESAVWFIDPETSTVQSRSVHISALTSDGAVVTSGLTGGETIVSAGARFLTEGRKVRIER